MLIVQATTFFITYSIKRRYKKTFKTDHTGGSRKTIPMNLIEIILVVTIHTKVYFDISQAFILRLAKTTTNHISNPYKHIYNNLLPKFPLNFNNNKG